MGKPGDPVLTGKGDPSEDDSAHTKTHAQEQRGGGTAFCSPGTPGAMSSAQCQAEVHGKPEASGHWVSGGSYEPSLRGHRNRVPSPV